MRQIFVLVPGCGCQCRNVEENDTLSLLFENKISKSQFYAVKNGKLCSLEDKLEDGQTYHIVPRLLGGKGGFGSMLRALGAQFEKTTNREACRDISGRRMRDVNNEQKLREWVAKAADREKEKEQRRRDRLERRRAEPKHTFNDPEYTKQKTQVKEELEDALQQGLEKASSSTTSATGSRKRKSEEPGPSTHKKLALEWLGVENISDLDTDSDSDDDDQSSVDCSLVPAQPVPGPSRFPVLESGAVSGASSLTTEHDGHSDSGVESVPEVERKGASPMDVDSDSTKDSAMNSDAEPLAPVAVAQGVVIMNSPAKDEPDTESKTQDGLLAQLEPLKPASEQPPRIMNPAEVDLMMYNSVEDFEPLGLDTLKAVLMSKGMKCGGTLQDRAQRLWAARGLAPGDIDPSLLAKPARGKNRNK